MKSVLFVNYPGISPGSKMDFSKFQKYCTCPENLYTEVSDTMAYANCADQDQTGAVLSGSALFAIPLF